MAKVQPVTQISVDAVDIPVSELPEGVKALVGVYEEWTQKELDAADDLQLVRAAKETLGRQIISSYRQFKAEQDVAAAPDEVIEPAPAPAPAPAPVTAEDLKTETVIVTGDDSE